MTGILWTSFVVLLGFDLLLAVVRGGLLNAHVPLLLTRRELNPKGVERTVLLLERPRMRTSLRVAVMVVHYLLLGVAIWMLNLWLFKTLSFGLFILLVALAALLLLTVEFLVEGLILPHAEIWALRFSGLAQVIDFVFSPISTLMMPLLGSPAVLKHRMSPVTEDDLKSWVEEEQPAGSLEQGERRMIYSIFRFGDTLAREVMVPRIDLLALEVNTSLEEAITALNQSGHSRVPVYEETVDNILGLVYAKDLLRVYVDGEQKVTSLRSLLRPAYFVPEAKKVDELLREMQARSVHMALVVDEYGGIAGLVTLEDIVEEIVGEIRDEYDQGEEHLFEKVSDVEYIFHGRIDLDDFNNTMGTHLLKDDADTLGGFIYSQLGRVPLNGEKMEVENVTLTIEQISGRRIRRVRALRQNDQTQTEEKIDGLEAKG